MQVNRLTRPNDRFADFQKDDEPPPGERGAGGFRLSPEREY